MEEIYIKAPTTMPMSLIVMVFERRHDEAIHALQRPASEKRHSGLERSDFVLWLIAEVMPLASNNSGNGGACALVVAAPQFSATRWV